KIFVGMSIYLILISIVTFLVLNYFVGDLITSTRIYVTSFIALVLLVVLLVAATANNRKNVKIIRMHDKGPTPYLADRCSELSSFAVALCEMLGLNHQFKGIKVCSTYLAQIDLSISDRSFFIRLKDTFVTVYELNVSKAVVAHEVAHLVSFGAFKYLDNFFGSIYWFIFLFSGTMMIQGMIYSERLGVFCGLGLIVYVIFFFGVFVRARVMAYIEQESLTDRIGSRLVKSSDGLLAFFKSRRFISSNAVNDIVIKERIRRLEGCNLFSSW
ncbi:hypothetical protein ACFL16_03310, partial [Patescibacteria group bacterium]